MGISPKFLRFFHSLLASIEAFPSIPWTRSPRQPTAAAFAIHNPKEFRTCVLPTEFHHENLLSFQRQLNTHSFAKEKSESGSLVYAHPHFDPSGANLHRIIRKPKNGGAKNPTSVDAKHEEKIAAEKNEDVSMASAISQLASPTASASARAARRCPGCRV